MNKQEKQTAILAWYDSNKRVLPWRENKEPYRVWISEIMLQQTKVATVIPYYDRFLKKLPNIKALANADDDLLNKLWEGLGYYSRVRNLKKAAIQIESTFNGEVPDNYEDLVSLSGIGDYTAGALLSIAFDKHYTAVDGNVLRVFARVEGIEGDIKETQTKKLIKATVEGVIPTYRIGDFNQSLMEIGATICLPSGKPKCQICPLVSTCKAYLNNMVDTIPAKRKKKIVPIRNITVVVLKCNELFGIRKRPSKGLLANMYEFYNEEGHADELKIKRTFPDHGAVTKLKNSKHKFTHLVWNMVGYIVDVDLQDNEYIWLTKDDINEYYSIPTAFKEYKKELE